MIATAQTLTISTKEMEYRSFGRTGMRVSVVGLGCGGFGGIGSVPELFGKGEDKASAFALMDRAWDAGINYFDTADSYGGGLSETIIGDWLQERGVRDGLVLSTKVFYAIAEGPNDRSLSRRHIMQAVEGSLRRLQTDYLDLYVIMEPDPSTPIDALRAAAAERGLDTGTLALAWVLSHPAVTSALIGPRTVEQFKPWLDAVDVHLTNDEREAVASRMEAAPA